MSFYRETKKIKLDSNLKDQLARASSSIRCLNLAETAMAKKSRTKKDRERYFFIAFGSIRECQAITDLEPEKFEHCLAKLDHLAASVYKLTHS